MHTTNASGPPYGSRLGNHETAGLVLSLYGYPPHFQTPMHVHEEPFFHLAVRGTCLDTCRNRTRTRGSSTLLFQPAEEPHADHWHGTGGRCFHVQFTRGWTERFREHALPLDDPAEFRGGLEVALFSRLYCEFRRLDAVSALVIEGLALELMAATLRVRAAKSLGRTQPRWLSRVNELIHVRFQESLSLDVIAAEAGVHPVHLATVFRNHFGCTVGEYLRRLRTDFACRRLRTSNLPLVQIALEAGFSDQTHFCRVFKRQTGLTPSEFRRILS